MKLYHLPVKFHLIQEELCLYYLNPEGNSTSEEGKKLNKIDDEKILKKYGVTNE